MELKGGGFLITLLPHEKILVQTKTNGLWIRSCNMGRVDIYGYYTRSHYHYRESEQPLYRNDDRG